METIKKVKVKLTAEQKAELTKYKEYDKRNREYKKLEKQEIKKNKELVKKELTILQYMLKHDVLYYHHGRADSLKASIERQIIRLKTAKTHEEYNPYIWNRYGSGNNYMQLSLMGRIWSHRDFAFINDVPLTGEYQFYVYDSGQRGLGAFDYITACLVKDLPEIPKVNPGAFPQITV